MKLMLSMFMILASVSSFALSYSIEFTEPKDTCYLAEEIFRDFQEEGSLALRLIECKKTTKDSFLLEFESSVNYHLCDDQTIQINSVPWKTDPRLMRNILLKAGIKTIAITGEHWGDINGGRYRVLFAMPKCN